MDFRMWLSSTPGAAFLTESKQSIISLRYPEVIASLLYERFGNLAPLMAKWFREYRYSGEVPDNWWFQIMSDYRRTPCLYDLTRLYSTQDPVEYQCQLRHYSLLSFAKENGDMNNQKKLIRDEIARRFFDDTFFRTNIVKDIESGKLRNLSPYKKLKFWDAQYKYDEKRIFSETPPLKVYKNGFRWINVGKSCNLVGKLMSNCGSSGCMSYDPDSTLLVLFGPENSPHVIITYSPNEKRLSSEQGGGSSEIKPKYHEYVLDLTRILGAEFDTQKTKSKSLKLKYMLGDVAKGLRVLNPKNIWDKIYTFEINGKTYYSNSEVAVTREDVERVQEAVKSGALKLEINLKSMIQNVFNYRNQPILARFGINYVRIYDLTHPAS
jgi:hypothetical protein